MRIFVVGSLNMDLVIQSPVMPKAGETISGNGFMTNPGGKGANQAAAAGKAGGEAYMVGCVGSTAFGEELKDTLKGYGVNVDYVRTHEGVSSGIAVIVVAEGDNRIILDAGANAEVCKNDVDLALAGAEAGDILIAQLEIPMQTVEYAMQVAKNKGMITILNPAPAAALSDTVLNGLTYITPNQTETQLLTGVDPVDESTVKKAAEVFSAKGVKNVVITMGAEGAALVSEGKYHFQPSFRTKAIDTTAAGDTFVGSFAVRLSEGASQEESIRFACAASSVAVSRRGAQVSVPTREEIEARLQQG
ncbi:MAG: ribokinase [Clostridia bacterium]|nr:ribokinase [Clostridia bacterium]